MTEAGGGGVGERTRGGRAGVVWVVGSAGLDGGGGDRLGGGVVGDRGQENGPRICCVAQAGGGLLSYARRARRVRTRIPNKRRSGGFRSRRSGAPEPAAGVFRRRASGHRTASAI